MTILRTKLEGAGESSVHQLLDNVVIQLGWGQSPECVKGILNRFLEPG